VCFKKGTDALHCAGGIDPAFIVVNSTLADIPGIDFLHRLRALPGRALTPIIFTTGKADRDLRRSAFELNVYAFLEKPINPTEFLVHAVRIVDMRRERADMQARIKDAGTRTAAPAAPSGGGNDPSAMIDAMLNVAAMHDPTIKGHHELSSRIAVALARELKLTNEEREILMHASRVYDIGKAEIPQRILESRSAATQADRVTIERHTDASSKLLAGHGDAVMQAALVIAQTHHERFDGSGYPKRLRGSSIPIMGRIVAVSDTMSALLRPRGDRAALSLAQAIEVIERGAGTLYDPAVVTAIRGNLSDISRIVHECCNAG
jgi:response regulator RpfG family c-di-GMP phosphodiesterase